MWLFPLCNPKPRKTELEILKERINELEGNLKDAECRVRMYSDSLGYAQRAAGEKLSLLNEKLKEVMEENVKLEIKNQLLFEQLKGKQADLLKLAPDVS